MNGRCCLLVSAILIPVITVEPASKASLVSSCIETRLIGQCNGKWPISLVYGSKPLIPVIAAITETPEKKRWFKLHFDKNYVVLQVPG